MLCRLAPSAKHRLGLGHCPPAYNTQRHAQKKKKKETFTVYNCRTCPELFNTAPWFIVQSDHTGHMQYAGILRIKSAEKIKEFLESEHVGRIASIDADGYPQIVPMNYTYIDRRIYMHSHTRGEKLDNIRRNGLVGFEVDREIAFLPSYFEHPTDASVADTLYISVMIKGKADLISDPDEKTRALNGLMSKYQPEGRYEPVRPDMDVIDAVSIIRVTPDILTGKYKIGQHMDKEKRQKIAQMLLQRGLPHTKETLKVMGFEIVNGSPIIRSESVEW